MGTSQNDFIFNNLTHSQIFPLTHQNNNVRKWNSLFWFFLPNLVMVYGLSLFILAPLVYFFVLLFVVPGLFFFRSYLAPRWKMSQFNRNLSSKGQCILSYISLSPLSPLSLAPLASLSFSLALFFPSRVFRFFCWLPGNFYFFASLLHIRRYEIPEKKKTHPIKKT